LISKKCTFVGPPELGKEESTLQLGEEPPRRRTESLQISLRNVRVCHCSKSQGGTVVAVAPRQKDLIVLPSRACVHYVRKSRMCVSELSTWYARSHTYKSFQSRTETWESPHGFDSNKKPFSNCY
jgi:hypothetical protein